MVCVIPADPLIPPPLLSLALLLATLTGAALLLPRMARAYVKRESSTPCSASISRSRCDDASTNSPNHRDRALYLNLS